MYNVLFPTFEVKLVCFLFFFLLFFHVFILFLVNSITLVVTKIPMFILRKRVLFTNKAKVMLSKRFQCY